MADKRVARRKEGGIRRWWRETIGELRKVSWPTRQEAIALTKIVIIVIVIVGIFLGTLDFLFSRVFAYIFTLNFG